MSTLLWLVVAAPFGGALILAVFGGFLPKRTAGIVGCVSVGLAWLLASATAAGFIGEMPQGGLRAPLYTWMEVDGLQTAMGLHLDSLSVVMMMVVTFVGFLIHLYAAQSMFEEDGYSRFFAAMNLFVGSMLVLALADNLLLLYLGWEGVGLCSYLLIGFWYKDRANVAAAQKAFIVTRVGDAAMAVGLFLLFREFGTLDIRTILAQAPAALAVGGSLVTVITFLLIAGAIGKSAQVPLHTWLPDAMAGPTPVSALIHAATMVTAGVYLIARMNGLFLMAPGALSAVAVIGTVTLLYAGFSALVQRDIKRVLAYSTISQIGYMFMALGVGAWSAAMFHLMTHAFFKALLFLSAGVVVDALHHERDLFRMGGLRRRLPAAFWTFAVGAASLSALPLVTAGFYSKEAIVWADYASELGRRPLLVGAMCGSMITAAYTFRALLLVFFGEQKTPVGKLPGRLMVFVLIVLAFFSVSAGFVQTPEILGHVDAFDRFVRQTLPATPYVPERVTHGAEWAILGISTVVVAVGLLLAELCFTCTGWSRAVERSPAASAVHRFLFIGWGFDWLYDRALVRPLKWIAFTNRRDFVDAFYGGLAAATRYVSLCLSATQTGNVRNYAAGLVLGAVLLAAMVLLKWS